eukprot:CAMPEP_0185753744 /NCGR_PEP_ID=MMETSP1174-20130828/12458_1 /TAXON_ID=35687 /ORGANISM="Dictyocha speculum, Strain CCMP1381" /LENGTH=193 /DNA_ID=CAMNT_0028431723 /DNA_START=144 /DNA_END=722 /DNA_ORIENTATION=-
MSSPGIRGGSTPEGETPVSRGVRFFSEESKVFKLQRDEKVPLCLMPFFRYLSGQARRSILTQLYEKYEQSAPGEQRKAMGRLNAPPPPLSLAENSCDGLNSLDTSEPMGLDYYHHDEGPDSCSPLDADDCDDDDDENRLLRMSAEGTNAWDWFTAADIDKAMETVDPLALPLNIFDESGSTGLTPRNECLTPG